MAELKTKQRKRKITSLAYSKVISVSIVRAHCSPTVKIWRIGRTITSAIYEVCLSIRFI